MLPFLSPVLSIHYVSLYLYSHVREVYFAILTNTIITIFVYIIFIMYHVLLLLFMMIILVSLLWVFQDYMDDIPGCPNPHFPSDHLSIGVKFNLK